MDIAHPDAIFMAKYQGHGGEINEQAQYKLLAHLMKAPFFSELRTKQQLGYTVWAYSDLNDRIPGLRLSIQSAKKDPITLQNRVDAFLIAFKERLSNMTEEEYRSQTNGLIANLEEKDSAFYPRSSRLKRNISLDYTAFNHKQMLADALKSMTKRDISEFYETQILKGDRVIVRAYGKHTANKDAKSTHATLESLSADFNERHIRQHKP